MNRQILSPSYGGDSLEMIFPSIASAMGLANRGNVLGLPEAKRYVLMLVDGMGYDLLTEHADAAPYLSSLLMRPALTCGVPSTTATSLTSLGTGLPMGAHGVVGYTSRVPGTNTRLNLLLWDQDVDPLVWQPHATVLEQMQANGVAASVVNTAKFEHSGLTRCSQRGVPFHGTDSVWERLEAVLDASEEGERSVVYAYDSTLDHTGHVHGCTSPQWRDCLTKIDGDLRHLRDELPADVALIVTADHGMVDVPREDRFDLDAVPGLRDDITVVAGEARFRHLHTRGGAAEDVAARWAAELGGRALVRTREDAEAAGWFGAVSELARPRIGDVVVAALDGFAVFSSAEFALEMKMAGFHGSLTPAEMRIPLLIDF